jgi:MerR family copper efflux transcriptional regulator
MNMAISERLLKIGEISALSGMSVKTVRYYEELGLLIPTVERSNAGYRLFQLQVLKRLAFIKRARSLGLRLQEIRELLALYDRGKLPCPKVKQQLQRKVQGIEKQIAALKSLQSELQELLDRWQEQPPDGATAVTICPNIQAVRFEE